MVRTKPEPPDPGAIPHYYTIGARTDPGAAPLMHFTEGCSVCGMGEGAIEHNPAEIRYYEKYKRIRYRPPPARDVVQRLLAMLNASDGGAHERKEEPGGSLFECVPDCERCAVERDARAVINGAYD